MPTVQKRRRSYTGASIMIEGALFVLDARAAARGVFVPWEGGPAECDGCQMPLSGKPRGEDLPEAELLRREGNRRATVEGAAVVCARCKTTYPIDFDRSALDE